MIRHTLGAVEARRIAVINMPRQQNRRLGGIQSLDWTVTPDIVPLSLEPQSTADQWLGEKIQSQSAAEEATPGTLSYNPTPSTTLLPIGRWNSWNGPCGTPPPTPAQTTPSAVPSQELSSSAQVSQWVVLAAVLGAAASGLYLLKGGK
jgi:hypothetical protein